MRQSPSSSTSLLLLLAAAVAVAAILTAVTVLALVSPGMEQYSGTWRHILLPSAGDVPPISAAPALEDDDASRSRVKHEGNKLGSAFASSSSQRQQRHSHHHSEDPRDLFGIERGTNEPPLREHKHDDHWPSDEQDAVALDLFLPSLASLFKGGGGTSKNQQQSTPAPLEWRKGKHVLGGANGNNNAAPLCTARLIGSVVGKQQQQQGNAGGEVFPRAVEFSCTTNFDTVITGATRSVLEQREQRRKEAEQAEELRRFLERGRGGSSNSINNKRRKNSQQQNNNKDPDFNATIPPFRFLNWNETSLMFPIANVAVVIHPKDSDPDDSPRWFEGAASACIETQPMLEREWRGESSSTTRKQVTQSVLRVIIEISHHTRFGQTEVPVTSIAQLSESASMSIRLKLVPLGSRSPMRRQLVRWMRFPGLPGEQQQQKDNDDGNDQEEQTSDAALAKEMRIANTTRFFELRATERRLTRVGLGFRARLRRQDSESDNDSSDNDDENSPILSRWSVEVFRRVPRPRVECVAMFSRLLSIESIFQPNEATLKQQQQELEAKKNKKKASLVEDSDPFDDDDDEEEDDEETEKTTTQNRNNKKKQNHHHNSFPGMDVIESSQLQLVSAHQLRGVLDDNFALPELTRISPVTAVPCGPSPKQINDNDEVFKSRKLPPRGLYILYVSEERPREHSVDIALANADFHFIAPLKLEKRLKSHNITFHGQYEKLPLPGPPISNWTWFDSLNVSLLHKASSSKTTSSAAATLTTNPVLIAQAAKQKEVELRSLLPRLLFQFHNHSVFPGFSIHVEQSRPIDDLQVWVCDGKNDTLFIDEERHVPFTVKHHQHDPVNSPLFGWRFAIDSQRAFALDTLYVNIAFRLRRPSALADDEEGFLASSSNKRKRSLAPPTAAEFNEAVAHWDQGREAARHLVSWVNDHRWVPILPPRQHKQDNVLPVFANFATLFREQLASSSSSLVETIAVEADAHTGAWRVTAKRDIAKGSDIFTLPWSVLLRHSQAPSWMMDLVDSAAFERILRQHDGFLLNSDHADLDNETNNNSSGENDANSDNSNINNNNDADDEEVPRGEGSKRATQTNSNNKNKKKQRTLTEAEQQREDKITRSRILRSVRHEMQSRRASLYSNVKAWTILTIMHWAQAEPDLTTQPHGEWNAAAASVRWHAHYRMFSQRVRNDAARRLRLHVLSKKKQQEQQQQQQQQQQDTKDKWDLPSSSWTPLVESVERRSQLLTAIAEHLMQQHPGLAHNFSDNSNTKASSSSSSVIDAVDWFISAYTIIEARSLLVSSPNRNPEWVFPPLLDLVYPSSDIDANVEAGFVQSSHHSTTFGLQVRSSSDIAAGTPLSFGGWAGDGVRTATHALEIFGRVSAKMGFTDTASVLLPYGPVLTMRKSSRIVARDECMARCRRVNAGFPVGEAVMSSEQQSVGEQNKNNQNSNSNNINVSSCCDFSWLDAMLRRRWKQVAAQEMLWNLGPELLRKRLVTAGVQNFLVPSVSSSLSSSCAVGSNCGGGSGGGVNEDPLLGGFAAVAAVAPEPPMWRDSRQHLLTGTMRVLESHILSLKLEPKIDFNNMTLDERLRIVFGEGGVRTMSDLLEKPDSGTDPIDVAWYGCCQGASVAEDIDDADL